MRLAALTTLLASTRAASAFTPSLASLVSGASVAFVPSSVAGHRDTSVSQLSTTHRSFRSSTSCLKMSAEAQDKEALINCPTIPLRDGTQHPAISFGTYKVGFIPSSASSAVATGATEVQRTAEECVSDALSVGYRSLECAEFYGNESEVGKAIAKSGVSREELFLCSKVWTTTIEQGEDAIRAQLDKTLADLGTDYVDLYLVHWPVPGKHVEAYKTLEKLCKEGKCRNIGLSNYAVEDYQELKDSGIEILPAVNQIEINPFLYRKNTLDFFEKEGVVLQSYRSLRDGKAFDDETVIKIANAKGKTPAQILGRWCIQKGYVYMPKSVKKERMIENGKVFGWELSAEEMAELDSLTNAEAFTTFEELYRKCVNRDTSKDGTLDGVKMSITKD